MPWIGRLYSRTNRNAVIELPKTLSDWIQAHFPIAGGMTQIQFRPCRRIPFWWIPGNRDVTALTLWNRVYLRSDYGPIDPEIRATVELVFHELIHVMQFRRNPLIFPLRYLLQHLRYGYMNNPAEVEARSCARQLAATYFRDRNVA
jgi:hypothetical protein